MNLESLKSSYSTCTKCEKLCASRSQVVFGSGNPTPTLLLIGEAPGATEDKKGIPFCGMSGKILQELLATIGLSRDDVFITNTILCRPESNRNPSKEEIANCKERLEQTIIALNPAVIATVGNFATKAILGSKAAAGITKIRGQIFETQVLARDFSIVPVVHPASYLYSGRSPVVFEAMKRDFQTIKEIVAHKDQSQKPAQRGLGEF